MGRSITFKSPAKVKRSCKRLISHLIKSQKKHLLPECTLPDLQEISLQELALPQLALSELPQPKLSLSELALPEPTQPEFNGRNHPRKKLEISNVKLTNFPEACPVCYLHQCELDFRHTIYFTVFETLEYSLAKLEKKPPDEKTAT